MRIVRQGTDRQKKTESHNFELLPGRGKLITTYSGGNESPLEPFFGEPKDVWIETDDEVNVCQSMFRAISSQDQTKKFQVGVAVVMLKKEKILHKEMNRFKP